MYCPSVRPSVYFVLTKYSCNFEGYEWTQVELHSFLNSALDEGEWSASHSGRFTPEEDRPVPIEQKADIHRRIRSSCNGRRKVMPAACCS